MPLESVIQFRRYFVENIEFNINKEFDSDNVSLEFELNNDIEVDREQALAILHLSCEVFPNYLEKNKPFNLTVKLEGIFTYENIEESNLDELISVNAVSILFPYLRSTISTITSASGFPALILPTINVHNYLSKQNKSIPKEIEDEKIDRPKGN